MDTRRLRCLLVREGLVVVVTVHDRDARVAVLETELRTHVDAATQLELFVARCDGAFLNTESSDAQRLAYAKEDLSGSQFLTPANAMTPLDAVHDYFRVQPPLSDGVTTLVHVLARVRAAPRSLRRQAPREDGIAVSGTATARLVASARHTRPSLAWAHHGAATISVSGTTPRKLAMASLVLRCASPRGILWLSGSEDASTAKTTLVAPPAWRALSGEIFRWLQLDEFVAARGRRAVLVGAPRAGKSAFLGFVVLQLLWLRAPRPVCVVDVPGVTFARIGADRTVLEGTRGQHFTQELSDPQTIYLFDSASSSGMAPLRAKDVHARSILVAPHLPAVPQPRVNGSTPRTKAFVLPSWTLDEVRLARHLCVSADRGLQQVAALYAKWGGVPGRLCTCDLTASEATLESALARLPFESVVVALATLQRKQSWHEVAMGHDSARWRPLVVVVAGEARQGFAYSGQVAFTSQYVCDRVLATVRQSTWTLRRHAAPQMPALWRQIGVSLAFLAQEEEEKHETPPPSTNLRMGARRSPW